MKRTNINHAAPPTRSAGPAILRVTPVLMDRSEQDGEPSEPPTFDESTGHLTSDAIMRIALDATDTIDEQAREMAVEHVGRCSKCATVAKALRLALDDHFGPRPVSD